MNTLFDTILASPSTPLGECISYENAPKSRLDYIKRWAPDVIEPRDLTRVFKRDIIIDSFVERISNVNVYYIESMHGRDDELYYFSCNNRLFHGEKIWSGYHPFLSDLNSIPPTAEVKDSSWFVGSRNNYTHQLIDFLPNLIFRSKTRESLRSSVLNIFGKTNKILQSFREVPNLKSQLNAPSLFLEELGEPVVLGPWRIRCIAFRDLILVRHLSVFKAFSLVQSAFNLNIVNNNPQFPRTDPHTVYLSRADKRVLNQKEIETYLLRRYGATIIRDMSKISYVEKARALSMGDRIILPPGSDNINALCFSSPSSLLLQMIPVPTRKLLESPFTSYACLRYLLPFLHRSVFMPSIQAEKSSDINSGTWKLKSFQNLPSLNTFSETCL